MPVASSKKILPPLPRWAWILIGMLGLMATSVLSFLNPAMFPFLTTIMVMAVYIGSVLVLSWLTGPAWLDFCNRYEKKIPGEVFSEISASLGLALIGFLSGSLAGLFWWVTHGSELAMIQTAMVGGGIIGCLPMVF